MKWVLVNVYLSLAVFRHCDRCGGDPVSKDVKPSTACYGSDPKCNLHNLTCHGNSVYITIWNASYGIKNKKSCVSGVAACNNDSMMCCLLNKSDLFVLYNINDMHTLTGNCSDKRQCIFKAPRTTHIVNGGGQKTSSYSVIRYSCLAEATSDAPATSAPVGAIVGGVIALIVVAAVVVAGFFWYRRRQKDCTEPRADRQVPAISKPTEPYMINGIYVQNTETDDYARIDENKLNETAAVVSPYETASADEFAKGGKDDQDRETEEGYTLAKDVPDVRASLGEVSASADEFAKRGKPDQDRETEEGYTLAKDVPDVRASPGEESGKGQNRIAVDAGEEDQYNRITFQPGEVRPQPNYSHVVGSGKQENEDPDYDHFDTNTGHGRNYIIDDYDVTHI